MVGVDDVAQRRPFASDSTALITLSLIAAVPVSTISTPWSATWTVMLPPAPASM